MGKSRFERKPDLDRATLAAFGFRRPEDLQTHAKYLAEGRKKALIQASADALERSEVDNRSHALFTAGMAYDAEDAKTTLKEQIAIEAATLYNPSQGNFDEAEYEKAKEAAEIAVLSRVSESYSESATVLEDAISVRETELASIQDAIHKARVVDDTRPLEKQRASLNSEIWAMRGQQEKLNAATERAESRVAHINDSRSQRANAALEENAAEVKLLSRNLVGHKANVSVVRNGVRELETELNSIQDKLSHTRFMLPGKKRELAEQSGNLQKIIGVFKGAEQKLNSAIERTESRISELSPNQSQEPSSEEAQQAANDVLDKLQSTLDGTQEKYLGGSEPKPSDDESSGPGKP